MPDFHVTFENIAYSNESLLDGEELSSADLVRLNQDLIGAAGQPQSFQEVVRVSLSADDGQADGGNLDEDRKVFVSVGLKMKAADMETAENFTAPSEFLDRVLEKAFDICPKLRVSPEEDWENLEADEAPTPCVKQSAAPSSTRRSRPG